MQSERMKVVIVGGVAVGPKTAARLRRLNPEAEITILEKGKVLSYAGCGMPYYVSGDVPDSKNLMDTPAGVIRDSLFFLNVKGITVLDRTLAEKIDRKAKTVSVVHLETGEHKALPYDKLVLATGGSPIELPIPGKELNHVFRMWQPEDALAMRSFILEKKPRRGVIIGGGLIGIEMTEALVKQGLKVSVVEMLPFILPGLLDVEVATYLNRYLRMKGVDVRCSTRVTRIEGDDQGNVQKVITEKGDIPADLVLISVGVRPNSKLAKEAGLEVGEMGDIRANEYLQTNDPDIYAGGDCVQNIHLLTGKAVFAPMGSTANKHGRLIANNIMGYGERFKGILSTAVVKVFDYNVGKSGLTESQAREAGFEVVTTLVPSSDIPHYYPTKRPLLLKLIADRKTRKILGIQGVGPGEVVKRIDVLATAMSLGATIDDLPSFDLGYAPPYSTAIDISAHAANVLRNKTDGIAPFLTPMEVKEMADRGEDFLWLDVRSPEEHKQTRIEDPRVKLVPLGMLRRRLQELPREKKVVTLCKAGLRAYEAQTILEGAGFKDAWVMDGGLEGWPYERFMEKK
ncbi:MAG TPA: FAD-dependent oxidoreductase [Thermodesulfobacteriota bacterium]|nr:FAD-dependent oxidoreductase [Thermodesulfobacteriota bacterium]